MKRVALIAYAISPIRGSEYSVSWNYIKKMNKLVKLDVYFGCAGEHLGDFYEMKYFDKEIINNVNFIKVRPGIISQMFNWFNKKNIFTYLFYVAYRIWHKKVFKKIESNIDNYDVIHFLSPHGYRAPGSYYKLNVKTVWGPIGGFGNVESKFLYKPSLKNYLRTLINNIQIKVDPELKSALKFYDVIYTSHDLNKLIVKKISGRDTIVIPENGIISNEIYDSLEKKESNVLKIIWIGSIDFRKSLDLLIISLKDISFSYKLTVVGDGPFKNELETFSKKNNINANFVGNVDREQVKKYLLNSDLHVITSLLEGNPTVLWESMSAGVPTLSLKNSGMASTICSKCGVLIEMENREQVILDIRTELTKLSDKTSLLSLTNGLKNCREKYVWESRINLFLEDYNAN